MDIKYNKKGNIIDLLSVIDAQIQNKARKKKARKARKLGTRKES